MRIVVAPDSFKGSITAAELCAAVERGIRRVVPEAEIVNLPLADGGEGLIDSLLSGADGKVVQAEVEDPLGRPIVARYGALGDGRTAVIEMAQASGLPLLREDERNPRIASSYGTGQLIMDALEKNYRRFVIGLGGSATSDGGAGMLSALGAVFLNAAGQPLARGGESLLHLDRIDVSRLDPRLAEAEFLIASDVTNPLCGPQGAAEVFGPQKGASPQDVRLLDAALGRYGEVIEATTGRKVADIPGSGAAGGMGAAFPAFLRSEMRSGIDLVMDILRFEQHLPGTELIWTGEGKLDKQTLSGKVISGVCRRAKAHRIPVIALCGSMDIGSDELESLGLAAAFSVVPGPCSLAQAFADVKPWTERCVEQAMRVYALHLRS